MVNGGDGFGQIEVPKPNKGLGWWAKQFSGFPKKILAGVCNSGPSKVYPNPLVLLKFVCPIPLIFFSRPNALDFQRFTQARTALLNSPKTCRIV